MTVPPSAEAQELFTSKINTTFSNDLIKEVLRTHFSNPKVKISDDAVELMTELMKVLVTESAIRGAKQCSNQGKSVVSLDHMESALPQLMLDFP